MGEGELENSFPSANFGRGAGGKIYTFRRFQLKLTPMTPTCVASKREPL